MAHGFNRGFKVQTEPSPAWTKVYPARISRWISVAPPGLEENSNAKPTAEAVGYFQKRLRHKGCAKCGLTTGIAGDRVKMKWIGCIKLMTGWNPSRPLTA